MIIIKQTVKGLLMISQQHVLVIILSQNIYILASNRQQGGKRGLSGPRPQDPAEHGTGVDVNAKSPNRATARNAIPGALATGTAISSENWLG